MTLDLFSISKPPKTVDEAHVPAEAMGADCHSCPMRGSRRGPVMGEVVPNSILTSIGEAPGGAEVETGRPFQGPSGMEYSLALGNGGLDRSQVTTTNTILCQPPLGLSLEDYLDELQSDWKKACAVASANDQPFPPQPKSPIECCAPRLRAEVATANSKVILAIGGRALKAVADTYGVPYGTGKDTVGKVAFATIKYQHGSPMTMPDGKIVCSALHPAFAMKKNRQFTQIIRENIARAAEIARRGYINWTDVDFRIFVPKPGEPEPGYADQAEALLEITTLLARFVQEKVVVTVDIETDSAETEKCRVRCIGLGAVLDGVERVITVPFRWMDQGRHFWATRQMRETAEEAVRAVLDGCDLIMHNGLFDSRVCLRVGLMTDRNKRWYDPMIGQKNTDSNDLPHDLGFVTRQFLEAPLWKKDVDHKAAAGVAADYDLHLYNGRGDVAATMRIWPKVEERILACATLEQMRVDTKLLPVARDMGALGVWIDERERGRMSLTFNTLTRDLKAKFQALVGYDINPRSPPQLRKWLYEQLALPKFDSEGFEIEEDEDEDPSTGVGAVMKLLDLGLDPHVVDCLDALLEYRACDKIRGTYVDKLRVSYDMVDYSPFVTDPVNSALIGLGRGLDYEMIDPVFLDGRELLPARPDISRLFINWKMHVIPGGRWSSDPTIQNWPARGWMVNGVATNTRKMIVAPPGHVFVGADMEQVELRIYGVVAGDKYILKAIKDNLEPHCLNAATILATSEDGIMPLYAELSAAHFKYSKQKPTTAAEKEEASKIKFIRTVAKRVMYLKSYGGEHDKLFSAMASERDKATNKRVFPGLKKERVDEWEERWERRHPETKKWHAKVNDRVRRFGYVEAQMLSRRKRYFIGGPNKKNAPNNHEIQGTAGEMKNNAILRIVEQIPFGCWSPYTGAAIDIHDFLAVIVPDEQKYIERAKKVVEEAMYHEMETPEGWMMPFPAEAKASRNLADVA